MHLPKGKSKFNSVVQSCLTLCDPMDGSMPGFPVHYQFLELAQTHVHGVGDTIQPSISSSVLPFSSIYASMSVNIFQIYLLNFKYIYMPINTSPISA